MTARRITAALLREHDACADQVAMFEKAWPMGCVPTLAACKRAARLGLDIDWAASRLLSPTALKAYEVADAPALKAYEVAVAPALKPYEEAGALARKAYYARELLEPNDVTKSLIGVKDALKEAGALALKAYYEAGATAFAAAWEMDNAKETR